MTLTSRPNLRTGLIYVGLTAIVLTAVLGTLFWVQQNVVQIGRDAAGHLEQSILVANALWPLTVQGLFKAFTLDNYRPPALYLATQPAYWLFGRGLDAAQAPNITMLAAIIVLTFMLARRVVNEGLALLAALLVSLLPMMAAMARLYYMELLLTTALLLALLALLKSQGFADRRWAWAVGACLGVMLLVKWTTPIYLFAPLLYVLWRHDFWPAQRTALRRLSFDWRRGLLALAGAAIVALLWYWPSRSYVFKQHMPLGDWLPVLWTLLWAATVYALSTRRTTQVGNFWTAVLLALSIASIWYLPRVDFVNRLSDVAFGTDRGTQEAWDPLRLASYTRYFGFWLSHHMGPLASAIIIPSAALGWLLIVWRTHINWRTIWRRAREEMAVYWLMLASSWIFLTLLAQANPRNLTPLLPVIAILLAASLRAFARPLAIAIGLIWIAVLGTQWAIYTVDAGAALYARTPQLWVAGDYLQWPATGSTDPGYWIHPNVLATIGNAKGEPDSLGILVDTWEIHRGTFRYLVARDNHNLTIHALTGSDGRGWSDALSNRWLLVKDGDNSLVKEPGQAVIDGIEHSSAHGYQLFHQLYMPAQTYRLPGGDTITLYHRPDGPSQPNAYPIILIETASVANTLNQWWSPGATLVFGDRDTAVWLGVHDLKADRVIMPQPGAQNYPTALGALRGTVFVVTRHGNAALPEAP